MSETAAKQPSAAVEQEEGLKIPGVFTWMVTLIPLIGAILIMGAAVYLAGPRILDSLTYDSSGLLPAAAAERDAAQKDHSAILRVEQICQTEAGKPKDFGDPFSPAGNAPSERLPGYLDAALYLSNALLQARSEFAGRRVISDVIMQLFEWTIVATGLFTTILISVKAFASPKSRGYVAMAVMAIVLSALNTSLATLNSFYRPRTTFETAERSLSSLQNLHRSLASGLVRQRDPCRSIKEVDWKDDWRLRKVRSQTAAFLEIMNAASVAAPSSDDDQSDKESTPANPQPRFEHNASESRKGGESG